MYDEDLILEESALDRIKGALGPFVSQYKKPLVAALIILAALYVYFFVLPKPVRVSITVRAVDGPLLDDAMIYLDCGGKTKTYIGTATPEILEGTECIARAEADYYLKDSESFVVSRDMEPVEITLPRDWAEDVDLVLPESELVVGQGEELDFNVEISNRGSRPVSTTVVAEGSIKDFVQVPPETTIGPGQTRVFTLHISVPKDAKEKEYRGDLRIKYTKKSESLLIKVVKAKMISVPTSSLNIKVSQMDTETKTVSVRNPNKEAVARQLRVYLEGEISELEWVKVVCPEDRIAPRSTVTITLTVSPPFSVPPGTYTGYIVVESSLGGSKIPVKIEVEKAKADLRVPTALTVDVGEYEMFTVKNTGEVIVENVTVRPELAGKVAIYANPQDLEPGESMQVSVQGLEAGQLQVYVSGLLPDGSTITRTILVTVR